MFKFNFDVDDDLDTESPFVDVTAAQPGEGASEPPKAAEASKQFVEVPLSDLLSALPPAISYSPLVIHASSGRSIALAKRDLFDARFQLISAEAADDTSGTDGRPSALDFVDAPSDLVSGVYEGGLKTWECSLDLAGCLDGVLEGQVAEHLKGKRVLELGCGTAVPTMYLLQELLAASSSEPLNVQLHLQDYNDLVFRLVTIFNLLLAWYMSPASRAFRENHDGPNSAPDQQDPLPPADATVPGELPISPELVEAFQGSLKQRGIEIHFFCGSWDTFDLQYAGGKYNIVLTSETIYRPESLPSLITLMSQACIGDAQASGDSIDEEKPLEVLASERLTISERSNVHYLCLVAAKLVYFGVGGGVSEFVRAVEHPEEEAQPSGRRKPSVQHLWERKEGVKRTVMRVSWL
ncbi:hypothetical protein OBBRIDRAFT_758273 [Obba rivulosa]|uniref:protein-histidine N-methyltransferase n=1 Tax=Obba rivulosa TaxID=1052685 RepID=A0A8E2APR6_9APHY|nr:hypothetical protein OBBRIDRAFT_758273 [Obba rivulosa]